jgi:hypothetical protein
LLLPNDGGGGGVVFPAVVFAVLKLVFTASALGT